MDIPESVISKIEKLLTLAEDPAASENEAAVAAAKAERLLLEYNLEADQIRGRKAHDDDIMMVHVKYDTQGGSRSNENVILAVVISEYMFCDCLTSSIYLTFIGRKQNLDACVKTYLSIRRKLTALAATRTHEFIEDLKRRRGWTSVRGKLTGDLHPKVWRRSWYQGAIAGVEARMRYEQKAFLRFHQSDEGESTGQTLTQALIIQPHLENQEWIGKMFPDIGAYTSPSPDDKNRQAVRIGYQDGLSVRPDSGELESK